MSDSEKLRGLLEKGLSIMEAGLHLNWCHAGLTNDAEQWTVDVIAALNATPAPASEDTLDLISIPRKVLVDMTREISRLSKLAAPASERELSWNDVAVVIEKHRKDLANRMSLADMVGITRDLNALLTPQKHEFCVYCGAGIGKFRREGEGTCPKCAKEEG